MGRKDGAAVPLSRRAGTPSNTMWPGPRSTSVPSGVFIHLVVWPQRTLDKNWGCAPLGEGKLGPHLTMFPGLRPTSIPSGILIHPAIWSQQIWADNWGAVPLWGGEAGSPSNNVARAEAYPHAKFHLDPSDRLATVHQCHRQEKTDNGPIAYGEPFYKIGCPKTADFMNRNRYSLMFVAQAV